MLERYYLELLGFVSRRLGNRDDARDIAQETYARVLASKRSGTLLDKPRALLFQTARNLMIDRYRRGRLWLEAGETPLADLTANASAEPENVAADRQQIAALLKTIEELPPRCREAFVLHRFEGLSHTEIANVMGISRNMVEKHMIRAILACRACDEEQENGD